MNELQYIITVNGEQKCRTESKDAAIRWFRLEKKVAAPEDVVRLYNGSKLMQVKAEV